MAGTATVYVFVSVAESVLTDPLTWQFLNSLLFPLTTLIAVSSLYLTLSFTEHDDSLPSSVSMVLLGIVSLSVLAAVTDPLHNLFIADRVQTTTGAFSIVFGPLFWVNTIVSLGIILVSITLLSVELTVARGIYREQLAALLLGFLIGVGFFLWEALAPITPQFNISTVGIVGWCGVTLWGIFRVELLQTAPIARKSLVESMDDAVFAIDADGQIVDLNPAASDQFDVDSAAVGSSVRDVLAGYPALLERIETRQSSSEIPLSIGEQERYFDVKISPIAITQPKVSAVGSEERQIGHTIVLRDITEHKHREQELERQNERLDRFASVVSHDLRSPLSVATGRLELAQEECDSEHLDAIETAIDRIDRITEDVLWLAREGRDIGSLESVPLRDAIESAWMLVADDATDAELVYDDALAETRVKADHDRLRQLLENLLRNAIEHGSENVTVTVGPVETGFYVEDDGPGIPEGHREDVFSVGYSTGEGGTGLGLSIVKEVAKAHGWEIEVTESSTGGARFEITDLELVRR